MQPTNKDNWIIGAALFVAFASLFINLGEPHLFLHGDEPRRALVTLEMILRQNFITPTLNGELYFNKPPLYNWILAASFKVFGVNEWALRFPTVLMIGIFVLTLILFSKKYVGRFGALLVALAFMTNARLLFYDSFLGMIDLAFGLALFGVFIATVEFYERGKYTRMFCVAYFLTALAFLMKALPALVFLITTGAIFLWRKRDLKLLLSRHHLFGIIIGGCVLGAYYSAYFADNPNLHLKDLWSIMVEESSRRTVVRFGWVATFIHFIKFPFEMTLNFLPWTFLGIYFVIPHARKRFVNRPSLVMMSYVFLGNLLIYWTSPEVTPRYLYMLVPMAMILCVDIANLGMGLRSGIDRGLRSFFIFTSLLLGVVVMVLPFIEKGRNSKAEVGLLSIFLGILIMGLSIQARRRLTSCIATLGLCIALARVGYGYYMLPFRAHEHEILRVEAQKIGEKTKGHPLYLFGEAWVQDGTSFYLTRARGEILRRQEEDDLRPNTYYLVEAKNLDRFQHQWQDQLHTLYRDDPLYLVWVGDLEPQQKVEKHR